MQYLGMIIPIHHIQIAAGGIECDHWCQEEDGTGEIDYQLIWWTGLLVWISECDGYLDQLEYSLHNLLKYQKENN